MSEPNKAEGQTYHYDVFISYSSADAGWVREWLLPRLEDAGLKVCIDFRDFRIGAPSLVNMEQAVERSRRTLLILTPAWTASEWTNFEALMLQTNDPIGRGRRMLPLMLEACDLPARLSIFTWADFRNPANRGMELARLLGQIREERETPAVVLKPPAKGPEKISLAKLPSTSPDLFGREGELATLDEAWDDAKTRVVSIVAWGGVGKTALVNKWLLNMGEEDYRGAELVFGWSFYSQGAAEGRQTSADLFIAAALVWFGDPDPDAGDPWQKGERLAELVRARRTLLVLDGLEPLQHPPGELEGRLKDPALEVLLRALARHNRGLLVLTTRLDVDDLKDFVGSSVQEVCLEHLPAEAGAAYLGHLGVQGTEAELKEAVEDLEGHALALTLLGGYLRTAYHGDVRQRDKIERLTEDRRQGGHARRVMAAYERWFDGKAELDILYMLGLFDRPAEAGAISALRAEPPIPGLTEGLAGLSEAEWAFALDELRRARLLEVEDPSEGFNPSEGYSDSLDTHPLVREHFGDRLQEVQPDAWREAHRRLYEYYQGQAPDLPDTLEEMTPLFAAVAHGCQAGRRQEALEEVYWRRIKRGNEHYSTKKLGAFGADLAALAGFFDPPWRRPAAGLSEQAKPFVVSWAGFRLRALGRLREAAQPMQAGMEAGIAQEDWKGAAARAGNLSELFVTLGDLGEAVDYARQSVDFADRSGDAFHRMVFRTTLADALHQAGRLEDAEALFREAEALQKEDQPEYPLLYSLRGYQYCDLLLGQGKVGEVQARARRALEIVLQGSQNLLDIALNHLSLGRAYLLKALHEDPKGFGITLSRKFRGSKWEIVWANLRRRYFQFEP